MIITLTRTGGFTGIPFKKTIDTATLPKERAKEVEELIAKVPKEPNEPKGPDRFIYSFSIQDEATSQEVKISEDSITPEIQDLITYLQSH